MTIEVPKMHLVQPAGALWHLPGRTDSLSLVGLTSRFVFFQRSLGQTALPVALSADGFRPGGGETTNFSAKTARNLHFAETLVLECDI